MNIKLSILLVLLFHFSGWGQNDTLNQTDFNGKRQGYWIIGGKDRPEKGIPPEGTIEEGNYLDGKKTGLWKKYYEDGKSVRMIGIYVNNRPFGKYAKYHLDGALQEEGSFSRGKYSGDLKRYYNNGQLAFHAKYNTEGKTIDSAFTYYENGCLDFIQICDGNGSHVKTLIYQAQNCNALKESRGTTPFNVHNDPTTSDIQTKLTYEPSKKEDVVIEQKDSNLLKNSLRNDPKWNKGAYDDNQLCSNTETPEKKYNEKMEIIFYGNCKDGKVWEGKMYFYNDDGILMVIEDWKNGIYFGLGQL